MRRRWPPEGGQPPSPHAAARRAATSAGTARIRANERGHGLGMGGTGVHPTGFRTTPPNVLHVICRFTVMADRGVLQRSRRAGWGGRSARYPLLGGRYAVRSLVGEGGMSEVMAALDTVLHRPVAVKILREHLAHDPIALPPLGPPGGTGPPRWGRGPGARGGSAVAPQHHGHPRRGGGEARTGRRRPPAG